MFTRLLIKFFLLFVLLFISTAIIAQLKLSTPNVESILYLSKGKKQSLIVGLGGSEGGNAWSSDYWKKIRDQFIEKGYAFLAIGYFKAPGTPDTLNKIAIEDIYNAIKTASKHSLINKKEVAIIGGSRGADLALLIASYYKNIKAVVSIVGSNAVFPGNTNHFSTASFTYQNQELPFVPVTNDAIPYLIKRDLRGAFETMLQDSLATTKAVIKVENIKGAVLFLSATKDEICPSTPMAEKMMQRLEFYHFKYPHIHHAIEGRHTAPLKRFDLIFQFLETNFKR